MLNKAVAMIDVEEFVNEFGASYRIALATQIDEIVIIEI
jgi:hypothetical protein